MRIRLVDYRREEIAVRNCSLIERVESDFRWGREHSVDRWSAHREVFRHSIGWMSYWRESHADRLGELTETANTLDRFRSVRRLGRTDQRPSGRSCFSLPLRTEWTACRGCSGELVNTIDGWGRGSIRWRCPCKRREIHRWRNLEKDHCPCATKNRKRIDPISMYREKRNSRRVRRCSMSVVAPLTEEEWSRKCSAWLMMRSNHDGCWNTSHSPTERISNKGSEHDRYNTLDQHSAHLKDMRLSRGQNKETKSVYLGANRWILWNRSSSRPSVASISKQSMLQEYIVHQMLGIRSFSRSDWERSVPPTDETDRSITNRYGCHWENSDALPNRFDSSMFALGDDWSCREVYTTKHRSQHTRHTDMAERLYWYSSTSEGAWRTADTH